MANEVNGIYTNVLDWINNDRPQGGGFILTQSDVVNALTDESELKPLSAKQGKILKAIIDGLVVDNLVTDNESKALSARQGKELAERIEGLSEVYQPLGDYQPAGNYAASVHEHQASDIQETTDKKVMTAEERNILSSLGTNFAKSDFSNVITKSLSQNGYYKFPDGFLIQWGYVGSSSFDKTTYFSTSFLNNQYNIQITAIVPSDALVGISIINDSQSTTSFRSRSRYVGTDVGTSGLKTSTDPYYYIAIGRWK